MRYGGASRKVQTAGKLEFALDTGRLMGDPFQSYLPYLHIALEIDPLFV